MRKKLAFILIIMVLIVQSIGGFTALATGDGTGELTESTSSAQKSESNTSTQNDPSDSKNNNGNGGTGTTSSAPEADISVKIENNEERIYKDEKFSIKLHMKINNYTIDENKTSATIDSRSAFYIPSSMYQTIKFEEDPGQDPGQDPEKIYKGYIDDPSIDDSNKEKIPLKYKGTGNELILNITYYIEDVGSNSTTVTLYIDNVVEEKDDNDSDREVDTTKYKPSIVVWGNTQMPTLEAGRKSVIPFYIKNQSQYGAKNIVVSLEPADDSSGITFDTIKPTKTVEKLDSNASKDLYFPVQVDSSAKTGIYSLKVNISYTNLYNDPFETSETIRVKVENNSSASEISLLSSETSPEVIKPGENAKLMLKLKNMGSFPVKNIRVSLTGLKGDVFIAANGIAQKFISEIAGGSTQSVEFELICPHTAEDGYKELGVKLEYENAQGEAKSIDSQIFLPVAASGDMSKLRDKAEDEGENKTVPRLIVNQYDLSDVAVKAGQKIGVSLSFLNTSQQIPIRNLKATFISADGVFTTEGSNSFFVQEVGPGKSFEKDINVFAKPDAEPKIYNLTIKLEYEDAKGNPYTSEELISIPIQQDAKLVVGDLNLSPENYVGQPIPIYIEFYNMGKATLYNLMIKVEGNFEEAKPSYFVGNFESGRSDYFDTMLTINTPGEISGRVLFTFEDSAGNPTEIAKEFVLNVMEAPAPPEMGEGMYPGMETPVESENNNNKMWIWGGSIIGAVVIIIVIIVLRKRHNKKKGMMFDEAI